MHDETNIRRRRDGSINTAHYMAKGRVRRAEAARDLTRAVGRASGRPLRGLAVTGAVIAILGRWFDKGM